jgi:hypothetical protein
MYIGTCYKCVGGGGGVWRILEIPAGRFRPACGRDSSAFGLDSSVSDWNSAAPCWSVWSVWVRPAAPAGHPTEFPAGSEEFPRMRSFWRLFSGRPPRPDPFISAFYHRQNWPRKTTESTDSGRILSKRKIREQFPAEIFLFPTEIVRFSLFTFKLYLERRFHISDSAEFPAETTESGRKLSRWNLSNPFWPIAVQPSVRKTFSVPFFAEGGASVRK